MTDGLHAGSVRGAIDAAEKAMPELMIELNRADSVLGDGDAGSMLSRLVGSFAASGFGNDQNLTVVFSTLARAAAAATGSSLGTLIATGLLAASRAADQRPRITDPRELALVVEASRDAMLHRGGSSLGDKTVIDAVDAIARALAISDGASPPAVTAKDAAQEALDAFRDAPCRIGRARMFGDKSRGQDDPGMLAVARLSSAAFELGTDPQS